MNRDGATIRFPSDPNDGYELADRHQAGRELDVSIAEKVLGFRVERIHPDWYGGREVLLFFRPGWPLIEYSYDEHSCNAMVFRNGEDGSDGTAPPLPFYSEEIADAWEVAEAMRQKGLRPILMPDWGKQWQVVVYRKSEYICQSDFVDSVPLAICRAALAAARSLEPERG